MKEICILPFVLLLLSSCAKEVDHHCQPPTGVFMKVVGFDTTEVRAVYRYRYEPGTGMQKALDSNVFFPVYSGEPIDSLSVYSLVYGDTLSADGLLLGSDWRIVVQPANVSWTVTGITWADAVYKRSASSSSAVPSCRVNGYQVNGQPMKSNVIFLAR